MVYDGRVEEAVAEVDRILSSLAPVETRLVLPQPAWHGHWQAFYRLKGTSPFLLIDLVIMKRSATNKFNQHEIHGEAKVYFDKTGFLKISPLDHEALSRKLKARKETLRVTFELFQPFVVKELNRKNYVEALAFYNSVTLRPLVKLLRIKHCPARHDFHTRYLYYDLPVETAELLEHLFFVSGPDDLQAKHREAVEWFQAIRLDEAIEAR